MSAATTPNPIHKLAKVSTVDDLLPRPNHLGDCVHAANLYHSQNRTEKPAGKHFHDVCLRP